MVAKLIGPDEFIPEAMSTSFVARGVFEKVRRRFPETILKFSSDNPRNPANSATPEELQIIGAVQRAPGSQRRNDDSDSGWAAVPRVLHGEAHGGELPALSR